MPSGPVSFPPIGVMVGAVCVSNLIKRHPNCKVLLHRREGDHTPNTDTFDLSEPDPAKCRALESSLWELKVCLIAEHYSIQTIHLLVLRKQSKTCWSPPGVVYLLYTVSNI